MNDFVNRFETTADICGWTASQRALQLEMALVGETWWQIPCNQENTAAESLRVFFSELHDVARQAYPNRDMQSRLSLVNE